MEICFQDQSVSSLNGETNFLNFLGMDLPEPKTYHGFVVSGDFFTDFAMVNHHFSPPFGRICLVHFFHPHRSQSQIQDMIPEILSNFLSRGTSLGR